MTDAREKLLAEIDAYLKASGMAASKLGDLAMDNPALVLKIRKGRNVRIDTAEKLRAFMRANPPRKRSKRATDPKLLAAVS